MNYRQGDIAYIQIDKLPDGLKKSASKVILKVGSGGNPHSFTGGAWYPQEKVEGTKHQIGFLQARDTILFHSEHGKKGQAKVKDGIYQVFRQVEQTHEGLRPVVD